MTDGNEARGPIPSDASGEAGPPLEASVVSSQGVAAMQSPFGEAWSVQEALRDEPAPMSPLSPGMIFYGLLEFLLHARTLPAVLALLAIVASLAVPFLFGTTLSAAYSFLLLGRIPACLVFAALLILATRWNVKHSPRFGHFPLLRGTHIALTWCFGGAIVYAIVASVRGQPVPAAYGAMLLGMASASVALLSRHARLMTLWQKPLHRSLLPYASVIVLAVGIPAAATWAHQRWITAAAQQPTDNFLTLLATATVANDEAACRQRMTQAAQHAGRADDGYLELMSLEPDGRARLHDLASRHAMAMAACARSGRRAAGIVACKPTKESEESSRSWTAAAAQLEEQAVVFASLRADSEAVRPLTELLSHPAFDPKRPFSRADADVIHSALRGIGAAAQPIDDFGAALFADAPLSVDGRAVSLIDSVAYRRADARKTAQTSSLHPSCPARTSQNGEWHEQCAVPRFDGKTLTSAGCVIRQEDRQGVSHYKIFAEEERLRAIVQSMQTNERWRLRVTGQRTWETDLQPVTRITWVSTGAGAVLKFEQLP